MKPKTVTTKQAARKDAATPDLFGKENYKWMLIGLVLLSIGFILMAGGRSDDPHVFNEKEIYSFRRITLAPIIIIAGFVIEIFAIFREPKKA